MVADRDQGDELGKIVYEGKNEPLVLAGRKGGTMMSKAHRRPVKVRDDRVRDRILNMLVLACQTSMAVLNNFLS